jgi:hypothetical protein
MSLKSKASRLSLLCLFIEKIKDEAHLPFWCMAGVKETQRKTITVTPSSNEISTDQLGNKMVVR